MWKIQHGKITLISIFILLLWISTSFLWGGGFYAYLDAAWNFSPNSTPSIYFSTSVLGNTSFFGIDTGLTWSVRTLRWIFDSIFFVLFWYSWWLFVLYILFFIFSYYISYLTLSKCFNKNSCYVGALFFTFNPISFYFLSQTGYLFSYFAWILFVYGIILFFEKKSFFLSLLLVYVSILLLLTYPRLVGFYGIIFILLAITFNKQIWNFLKDNFFSILKFGFFLVILLLPTLLVLYYQYFVDRPYFEGVTNYAKIGDWGWGVGYYNSLQADSFIKWFLLEEPTKNFQYALQSNFWYQIFNLIFSGYILFLFMFLQKNKKNIKLVLGISILYLLCLTIKQLPFLASSDIFLKVHYIYFPFIAGWNSWINVTLVCIIAFFIAYLWEYTKGKQKDVLVVLLWLFFFINSFSFFQNPLLKKVTRYPEEYQEVFEQLNIDENTEATIFPQTNSWEQRFYTDWAPYPVSIQGVSDRYLSLFFWNKRFVNDRQVNLAQKINNKVGKNNRIFNVKNVFLFKHIKNLNEDNPFLYFPKRNYKDELKKYQKELREKDFLSIKKDNEYLTHFTFSWSEDYDFFLYSPKKVTHFEMENFLKEDINIRKKPVNIDSGSFHKPEKINTFKVPEENKNTNITYKRSILQPTKIYAKITNIDSKSPFLMQLNQTFGMSWKVKWINKEDFEEKKCINEYQHFKLTQNEYCNYKWTILDISDTKYVRYPNVKEENHFEGNFVWNAWLIEPNDIPKDKQNKGILYAVIIYEKQIWYNLALIVSWATFIFLLLTTLFQRLKNSRLRKSRWETI